MSHATLGGSSCYRWANCPGSVAILHLAPPDTESDAAARGTALHWVDETRLNHWKQHGRDFDGIWPSYAPNDISLYEDMFLESDTYVDYVVDHCALNWENTFIEQRVSLSDDMYGTADCISYSPLYRHLDVFDAKHGRLFVPAVDNHQLAFYLIGAVRNIQERGWLLPETVTGHIIQPLCGEPRTWNLTLQELYTWWVKIFEAAQRAGEHTFNVGSWCEYCPGMASCEAHWARTEHYLKQVIVMTELQNPTPEQMAERKRLLDEAATFIKSQQDAVDKLAFHMAENQGKRIPGYKLVQRNTHRKYVDGAFDILCAIRPDLVEKVSKPRELISPANLDKIIDSDVSKLLIFKPDGGKRLVASEQPGAAVASKLSEWFNGASK